MSQTQPTTTDRQALLRHLVATYSAIRAGRLRVVTHEPNAVYRPRMEIYDNPRSASIIATLEIPGVQIDDLAIGVKQGKLEIKGRRRPRYPIAAAHPRSRAVRGQRNRDPVGDDGDDEMDLDAAESSTVAVKDSFPLHELRYGPFHRAIPLPPGVDTTCIEASLTEGLLTVSWPRSSPAAIGTATNTNDNANNANAAQAAAASAVATVERQISSVRGEPLPRTASAGRRGHTNTTTNSQSQK